MNNPTTTHSNIPSPCVGLCSTTYGDLVCLGCKRFASEVLMWPSASLAEKQVIWQRLTALVVPLMARHFVVENEALLRSRMQQLQVRHYEALPPLHIAWILLRKKLDQVTQESLATFGLAWCTHAPTRILPTVWNELLNQLQQQSLQAHDALNATD